MLTDDDKGGLREMTEREIEAAHEQIGRDLFKRFIRIWNAKN